LDGPLKHHVVLDDNPRLADLVDTSSRR